MKENYYLKKKDKKVLKKIKSCVKMRATKSVMVFGTIQEGDRAFARVENPVRIRNCLTAVRGMPQVGYRLFSKRTSARLWGWYIWAQPVLSNSSGSFYFV